MNKVVDVMDGKVCMARVSMPISVAPEFAKVRHELLKSLQKHGELPDNLSSSGLILSEEILESVEAGLKIIRAINDQRDGGVFFNEQQCASFYHELSQGAAVFIKIMHKFRVSNQHRVNVFNEQD